MRLVRRFCAFLLGTVFFLAGFLKLMDPVGAGLVMSGYFRFFSMGFLELLSKAAGVAMALLETLVGAAVITGVWRRITAVVSGIMLAFFTALTLVLLIAKADMDCGCFGEAIHLTHLQTFLKNIVLCVLWTVAYVPFSSLRPTPRMKYAGFGIAAVSVLLFTGHSLLSVPAVDFTPLAPGAELLSENSAPDAEVFSISDAGGVYRDELVTEGRVLVVSLYEPDRLSEDRILAVREFVASASANGFTPLVVASAQPSDHIADNLYTGDRKSLMTMNRSNGGATYIYDGQIIRKWPVRSLPSGEELAGLAGQDPTEAMLAGNSAPRLKLQAFLLYVFAVMLLL